MASGADGLHSNNTTVRDLPPCRDSPPTVTADGGGDGGGDGDDGGGTEGLGASAVTGHRCSRAAMR